MKRKNDHLTLAWRQNHKVRFGIVCVTIATWFGAMLKGADIIQRYWIANEFDPFVYSVTSLFSFVMAFVTIIIILVVGFILCAASYFSIEWLWNETKPEGTS